MAWLETGHPVTVGQSPAYDFSVSDEQKAVFLVSVSVCSVCDSCAGDWLTVTGCPISNPGNNCANGLLQDWSSYWNACSVNLSLCRYHRCGRRCCHVNRLHVHSECQRCSFQRVIKKLCAAFDHFILPNVICKNVVLWRFFSFFFPNLITTICAVTWLFFWSHSPNQVFAFFSRVIIFIGF